MEAAQERRRSIRARHATARHAAFAGRASVSDVVDIERLRKARDDVEAFKASRKIRLGCAAQLIAAARELVAGEPGYIDASAELETIQHELEDDSL